MSMTRGGSCGRISKSVVEEGGGGEDDLDGFFLGMWLGSGMWLALGFILGVVEVVSTIISISGWSLPLPSCLWMLQMLPFSYWLCILCFNKDFFGGFLFPLVSASLPLPELCLFIFWPPSFVLVLGCRDLCLFLVVSSFLRWRCWFVDVCDMGASSPSDLILS